MLTFAKKTQHCVDLIVSKSCSNNEEALSQLNHYVWVTMIILPIAIFTSAYNAYIENYTLAFLITLFSAYTIGSLFLISKIKETYLLYHGANIIYAFLILFMIYHTDMENSRILWAYIYPIGIIFLFGNRLGFLYSSLLLGMIVGLFLFIPQLQTAYNTEFQVRFALTYMIVAFISSWIAHHRERFQKESMQTQYALFLEQALLKEEIERRAVLEKELQYLAQTDPLTSLYNRGYFLEMAEKELQRAFRYDEPLCFAILDIDHFKRINDTFGHPVGDVVLQALGKHCLQSLRETDLMGRLGGEEFAFLLLHVNEEQARAKMEKLREELSQLSVADNTGSTLNFTVSIGLAMLTERIKRLDELYIQADEKLYVAKDAGRNCVR
jgi:diguanylate cyclase (GGDEF)-like protein